jgi:hypothetical protein
LSVVFVFTCFTIVSAKDLSNYHNERISLFATAEPTETIGATQHLNTTETDTAPAAEPS